MDTSPLVAAIILAAGSSSRMGAGRHKLLLPLGNRSVLAHVIDAVLASHARPIIVVLGHQAEQVRTHLATYTTVTSIVENPNYLQGMSTSIHIGLQSLVQPENTGISPNGALIILGDQPLITPHIINMLIDAKRRTGKHIVAPLYEGKRGNPILFDASLFPDLMNVTGDEGGRKILERYPQEIATVELGDAVASYDVDTWEAYQQVVAKWQQQQAL